MASRGGSLTTYALIGVGVGLVTAVALAVMAYRRRAQTAEADPDVLFVMGIIYAGLGASLGATIGPWMLGISVLGISLMVIGRRRRAGR